MTGDSRQLIYKERGSSATARTGPSSVLEQGRLDDQLTVKTLVNLPTLEIDSENLDNYTYLLPDQCNDNNKGSYC